MVTEIEDGGGERITTASSPQAFRSDADCGPGQGGPLARICKMPPGLPASPENGSGITGSYGAACSSGQVGEEVPRRLWRSRNHPGDKTPGH